MQSAAPEATGWIERRRFRYKKHSTIQLDEIRGSLKTGDIILFHKTARTGILDTLELDFVAPLFFATNEFRHSGIVVRRGDDLSVVECTEETHTGYAHAAYPFGGKGIREVRLELLLDSYTRDNGVPHFGVKLIRNEIDPNRLIGTVKDLGPVNYLKASRSIPLFALSLMLPHRALSKLIDRYRSEMMCSEFVHSVLAKCGALAEYPSKVFAPYVFENQHLFDRFDIAGYSDIVRFVV